MRKYAPIALALAPALFVQLTWLLHNTQLPTADASGSLRASFLLYQHFAEHRWGAFLRGLYSMRDWRPVAFYLLELPFQMISAGNMMFTASAVTLSCTAATCAYLYRLLRLSLEPKEAALGTALLGICTAVQWPGLWFAFTEVAFLPAVLATVYHLVRSQYLQDKWQSFYFVLAASAAFMLRPVEALTHLGPVFVIFLVGACQRRIMTAFQAYLVVTGAVVSAAILVGVGWLQGGFEPHSLIFRDAGQGKLFTLLGKAIIISAGLLLAGIAGRCAFLEWQRKGGLQPPYVLPAFSAVYGVVVVFYIRFVPELVEWIYMTSVGSLGALVKKEPLSRILETDLLGAGPLPFLTITGAGLLATVFCISPVQRKSLLQQPFVYLAAVIPLPLLLALFSNQSTWRKVTVICCVGMLLLVIPALMRGRWQHARLVLLSTVGALQLSGLMWIYTGHENNGLLEHTVGSFTARPTMVTTFPNPHDEMADFILRSAQARGFKHILAPVATDLRAGIDPFLLEVVVTARGQAVDIGFPYEAVYNEHTAQDMLEHTDADTLLMIHDTPGKIIQSPPEVERLTALRDKAEVPNDKLMFDLLALYAAGKLGAERRDCLTIASTGYEACLFAINKPAKM